MTERVTSDQMTELQQRNRAMARRAQVLAWKIEQLHQELDEAETDLAALDPCLFAEHRHVFTLVFKGGQEALVEVYGAPTSYHARDQVAHAFMHCAYDVREGARSAGCAVGTYRCWYSSAAQEVPLRRQITRLGLGTGGGWGVRHPDAVRAVKAAKEHIIARYEAALCSYAAFRNCSYDPSDGRRKDGMLCCVEWRLYDLC